MLRQLYSFTVTFQKTCSSTGYFPITILRHLLFSVLKALEEYPFAYDSDLKRHKKPRLGESIALKLTSDISILMSVLDGAPFEDMKKLSSSKPISDTCNLLQNDSISISVRETKDNSCKSNAEIELFRGLLSDFQADLISLKQDNDFVRNELSGEVKSLKNDLKSFKAEMRTVINELQTTVTYCQQTVENINDEHSNGVAKVKSDVKQVRKELQTVYEYKDEKDAKLCEKVIGAHKLEKQIPKLESKVDKLKPLINAPKQDSDPSRPVRKQSLDKGKRVHKDNTEVHFQAEPYNSNINSLHENAVSNNEKPRAVKKQLLFRCPDTGRFYRIPDKTGASYDSVSEPNFFGGASRSVEILSDTYKGSNKAKTPLDQNP